MSNNTAHTPIFKHLFAEVLSNNGKFHNLAPALRKSFTGYVYTSVPKFFVSDGNHFVTTYFTKD